MIERQIADNRLPPAVERVLREQIGGRRFPYSQIIKLPAVVSQQTAKAFAAMDASIETWFAVAPICCPA
jgi:hypothetical protein